MSHLSTAFHAVLSLPGLRGFWPLSSFDESGNAYDLSRHGQTLTANGNPTYNINPQGTGYLDYDGTGDYLSIADSAHFDILGTESYVGSGAKGLTYGCWAYLDSVSGTPVLMAKYDNDANGSYRMSLSGGQFRSHLVITSGITTYTAATLTTGQWYFLVARFTRGASSYNHDTFINGVKAGSSAGGTEAIANSSVAFTIGAQSGGGNVLNGRISCPFICAEAISDAQLDQLYADSWPLFNTFSVSTPADTITLTETVSRRLVSLVKPADTITLTEAKTVTLSTTAISQNQAVTLTEGVTARMVRQASQNETVTLTETATVNMARQTSQAETVTLTEAKTVSVSTATISQNQAVTLTEAQTVRVATAAVSQNEAVTLTEAQTVSMPRQTSQNETVTLSESATASMARALTASETVTLTEGVTVNMPRLVSQAETVTLSEAQTVSVGTATVSQSETITLSEAQTVRVATSAVSRNETVTLTEAQSVILTELVSQAETIALSETGTTVLLVSIVGQNETVTLSEGVSVTIGTFSTLGISVAETVTVGEITLISAGSTNLLLNVSELITLSEATAATLFEIVTIVIYDTLGLTDAANSPLFSVTDTLTFSDSLVRPVITDTLTLTDAVTIGNVTVIVEDTLTFSEVLVLDGPTVTPPATAATSELDNRPVLKLLYGNDKRDPIRELDLAQIAPGEIRLLAGGFAPGAGERNELWSGESIRFSGSKKLAESRKNSQLAITTVLRTGGSQAALSHAQRKTNRFFTEAKQHQLLGQNHTVWLEYRWSDGLPDLATPTFGQLSNYYEVYSATAPKWPDSLHNDIDDLSQGLIDGVVLNITGSPAPEGLKQRAAIAAGAVSMHDKGVLIASGSSSKLHWATYTGSGLTGTFTITGWITLNAVWGSGTKYVFDYYVSASNRISIVYDAGNNRWTITKIVGGVTFTTNSATDAVTNGDDVHLQLVQDATTLHLYVNGVSAASVTATATMSDSGLIALGCPGTGTIDGVDVILDGWRIMPDDITSTYALALYEAELPIKQDGGQVGPPLYFWTKDGDSTVDNCDDATRDNWGIIGGVGGDIEALTEIRLQLPIDYGNAIYYLGIRSQDSTFTPSDYIFIEPNSNTTTADGSASGGTYSQLTSTTIDFYNTSAPAADPALVLGQYRMLARVWMHPTPVLTLTPKFAFSNNAAGLVSGKAVSYTGVEAWTLVDIGDLFINTNSKALLDNDILWQPMLTVSAATSFTGRVDFIHLLPYPYARVSAAGTIPAGASHFYIVVEDGAAFVTADVSYDTQEMNLEYRGAPLVASPHKYNYLFLLQATSAGGITVAQTAPVTVYVTPRYLLPGGMVA